MKLMWGRRVNLLGFCHFTKGFSGSGVVSYWRCLLKDNTMVWRRELITILAQALYRKHFYTHVSEFHVALRTAMNVLLGGGESEFSKRLLFAVA